MKIPEEDWLHTLVKDVNIPQSLQVVNRRMKLITQSTNEGNIHCGSETIIVWLLQLVHVYRLTVKPRLSLKLVSSQPRTRSKCLKHFNRLSLLQGPVRGACKWVYKWVNRMAEKKWKESCTHINYKETRKCEPTTALQDVPYIYIHIHGIQAHGMYIVDTNCTLKVTSFV